MATKTENAVYGYDFTLKAENITPDQLKTFCKAWAKKWVFQLEEGDSGYEHYQGRISLIKKRRLNELIKAVKTKYEWPFHWSISSTNSLEEEFYCTKEDTRKEGPWSDKDKELYIPTHVRNLNLYSWQQQIVDDAKIRDLRHINLIVDRVGNHGKSWLKTYVGSREIGLCLPYVNDYKDIMRMVMDCKKFPLYIIDIPRAVPKERMYQFYAGIESLKDGYAYDDRYKFRYEYFEIPNVWIFTNVEPNLDYLSADRWKIWNIEGEALVEKRNF